MVFFQEKQRSTLKISLTYIPHHFLYIQNKTLGAVASPVITATQEAELRKIPVPR
jgi:hypothetical protein